MIHKINVNLLSNFKGGNEEAKKNIYKNTNLFQARKNRQKHSRYNSSHAINVPNQNLPSIQNTPK